MGTWRVRWAVTVEVTAEVEAIDEDAAEEAAARQVEEFLQSARSGAVELAGSIDGMPADIIVEVDA